MRNIIALCALTTAMLSAPAIAVAEGSADQDLAAIFGRRESIEDISLSPDGTRIAYIVPLAGTASRLFVSDLAGGQRTPVTSAPGKNISFSGCSWTDATRLICSFRGLAETVGVLAPFTRMVALDTDGNNPRILGQRDTGHLEWLNQYSGAVVDWLPDQPGNVLMTIKHVPETRMNTRLLSKEDGLGVERVDTRTLRREMVEPPHQAAIGYLSDGHGNIRTMTVGAANSSNVSNDTVTHLYRRKGAKEWAVLATADRKGEEGPNLLAVDEARDAVYALRKHNGRMALYRFYLDGSQREELVFEHPQVDIDDVVTVGPRNHVIGVSYSTDKPNIEYLEADYAKLAQSLSKALPGLPLISFVSETADASRLLIFAGSDTDPGRYYMFDRKNRSLAEIALARPELEGRKLGAMRPVSYAARDQAQVPAYLTLPPGGVQRNLPAIVMPHGGPSSRDEWGFDWLAQYFAAQGYAVLQPNFRGSAGFGDAWYAKNGFQSWDLAIGDVNDGARWLVAQGIADPKRLAIFGWSYGGYAALQANVVDPDLYKAVIAVAPVTDLGMLRNEFYRFDTASDVRDFVGAGPHVEAGSPAKHADRFRAPVLLFHGDRDRNVSALHSREMHSELQGAGKRSELVIYPDLDHSLPDSDVRADMLRKSATLLDQTIGAGAK